ncbi:MAG: right-handed parallel beta-helix repeat-containing protein [Lacrimispora celerecrescens]|nr:right-handed parallel beta-helix repeat-containing protein [Lacrimispora celerecrescens]
MKQDCVRADDFIADKRHAVRGLREAVGYAVKTGCLCVCLGRGTYILDEYETIETNSIAHDDGCGDIREKDCFLFLSGIQGLTIRGTCTKDGEPATVLAGLHEQDPQILMPAILWAESCSSLKLENIAVTRIPETASAGVVKRVSKDEVEVEVFPDLPCEDGMVPYCMNRFDTGGNDRGNRKECRLMGESLTYGFGYDRRFIKTGERTMCLPDAKIAGKVKVGEGLSWHQSGRTDFQLFFGGCDGLSLSNVRIYNTNGFAILTENCRNITARRLVIKPSGDQFFTGPRDGWKIYRCGGAILLDRCHVEGVRMDGQNVHSNFLIVERRIGRRELICTCKYAPVPLRLPSAIGIYDGISMSEFQLESWEFAGGFKERSVQPEEKTAGAAVAGTVNQITRYRLVVKEDLPDSATAGSLVHALCWEPDSYECRDSVFKNIAGAGHLLRCRNVTIRGCRYENLMNAGILIGAEFSTHCEGGHGENITIQDCSFINCGFKPRYGSYGMGGIAVKSQGFSGPYNRNIIISGCRFEACRQGIELCDAGQVVMSDLCFVDVQQPLRIEGKTTEKVEADNIFDSSQIEVKYL